MAVLIIVLAYGAYAGDRSVPRHAGGAIDDTLLLLKRFEIEADAQIERLTIDAETVERQWHEIRSELKEKEISGSRAIVSAEQSAALYEQLKTARNELQNAYFIRSIYKNKSALRRTYISLVAQKDPLPRAWKELGDSARAVRAGMQEEMQWTADRIAERNFEYQAISNILAAQADTLDSRVKKWITLIFRSTLMVYCRCNCWAAALQRPGAVGRDLNDAMFLWGKTSPNEEYLAQKAGIETEARMWAKLEARSKGLNFEQLARDLEPFAAERADTEKVLPFREHLVSKRLQTNSK
jgi:hypothetical protein